MSDRETSEDTFPVPGWRLLPGLPAPAPKPVPPRRADLELL